MICPFCNSNLIMVEKHIIYCNKDCFTISVTNYVLNISPYSVQIYNSNYNNVGSFIDEFPSFKNLIEFDSVIPLDITKNLVAQIQVYLILL